MKRLHVHVSVDNLADGIRFYSGLFATKPAAGKADYFKRRPDIGRKEDIIRC